MTTAERGASSKAWVNQPRAALLRTLRLNDRLRNKRRVSQTRILRRVVERIGEQATAGSFEYFREDIERQAESLLTKMGEDDTR
jgi:hypothetical protein